MRNKIIIDSAVPYIQGVFEPWCDVVYEAGSKIDRAMASDADALVIRTRTHCDKALLEGSSVKVVSTATIGMDHIDTEWCRRAGIAVFNAPGCNADAVMEYVFAALNAISAKKGVDMAGRTLGVIGVGHVGGKVVDMALQRGFKVLKSDPPRELAEGCGGFTPLPELLEKSDIVTLHIPLWPENVNFADDSFFAALRPGTVFINASRGEVVDEEALKAAAHRLGGIVMDVFRNEPHLDPEVIKVADIVTPHIAGYSNLGKINGTVAAVRRVAEVLDIEELKQFSIKHDHKPFDIEAYDIMADDAALRAHPEDFEQLRSHYKLRG